MKDLTEGLALLAGPCRVADTRIKSSTCGRGASVMDQLTTYCMRHRGYRKAIVAVGHEILLIAHCLLARETTYHELGAAYFDQRHAERTTRRCVRLLEQLGHRVTLEPAPATA